MIAAPRSSGGVGCDPAKRNRTGIDKRGRIRRRRIAPHVCLLLLSAASAHAADGTLIIGGGGGMPPAVIDRFVELAGGADARLVVIPTASGNEPDVEKIVARWSERGCGTVAVLHTRDAEVANTEGFVEPLRSATAVWMSGGAQSRLASAYVGGAVERELQALVERGGVVGGSSAGAAIQSKVMIAGGNPEPEIGVGFDLAGRVILDQHFLARDRMNRLLTAVRAYPDRLGVGIDEGTAIEVRNGQATVLGESYVVVVEAGDDTRPLSVSTLESGDTFRIP